jgi:hypothetical protein
MWSLKNSRRRHRFERARVGRWRNRLDALDVGEHGGEPIMANVLSTCRGLLL